MRHVLYHWVRPWRSSSERASGITFALNSFSRSHGGRPVLGLSRIGAATPTYMRHNRTPSPLKAAASRLRRSLSRLSVVRSCRDNSAQSRRGSESSSRIPMTLPRMPSTSWTVTAGRLAGHGLAQGTLLGDSQDQHGAGNRLPGPSAPRTAALAWISGRSDGIRRRQLLPDESGVILDDESEKWWAATCRRSRPRRPRLYSAAYSPTTRVTGLSQREFPGTPGATVPGFPRSSVYTILEFVELLTS